MKEDFNGAMETKPKPKAIIMEVQLACAAEFEV